MSNRALERERDKLLEGSGFEDIEKADGTLALPSDITRHVRRPNMLSGPDLGMDRYANLEEYYRLAGHFLWEREWYSDLERRCWELHAEGASYTRIVRTMKREGHSIYRRRVHSLVSSLSAEMLRDELAVRRGPGRPKDPSSLRQLQAGRLDVELSCQAALALDHVRAAMGNISIAEAVRRSLLIVARGLTR